MSYLAMVLVGNISQLNCVACQKLVPGVNDDCMSSPDLTIIQQVMVLIS